MGYLKEITSTIKDITTLIKTATNIQPGTKSIAKKAKEGILQFPAICTNSVEIDKIQDVCRALEKVYATFAQVSYSLDPVAVFNGQKGSNSITDYIKKHHTNMGSVSYADVINIAVNNIDGALESYSWYELGEDLVIETLLLDGTSNKILHENRVALRPYLEGLNESTVNDLCKPLLKNMVTEAVDPILSSNITEMNVKMGATLPKEVLTSNDAKKANEIVPTTLRLKVNAMDAQGELHGTIEFIIGVKVTIHPVSSVEIVNNLSGVGRDKFFNFIRWTSGEISFFKDLVFNLDQIKLDAINNNNKGTVSPWWATFKRLKAKSNMLKRFGGKGLIPNATLIVNMEEVEYIKSKTGVDLMDVAVVKKLMDQYLLFGFVVIDNSTEAVHIIYDSENSFQVNSFQGLKREANSGSSTADFKEMLKALNRF